MARTSHDKETYRYITFVNAIPALSRDEELRLARLYLEQGDQAAKHRVIQANLRHVVPHALRYGHYGVGPAELIGQGNLALLAALDRFEPQRGLRFSTYASHWVRAEILSLVLQQRSMVGGGRGPLRAKYVFQLRRQFRALMAKVGDREEVATILGQQYGKSAQQIQDIMARIDTRDASVDTAVSADSSALLIEQLPTDGPNAEGVLDSEQNASNVARAVHSATADLNERERFIVEHRLMAEDGLRMSLVQIGAHFGVSRERARQLEASLKNKLRKRLSDIGLQAAQAAA